MRRTIITITLYSRKNIQKYEFEIKNIELMLGKAQILSTFEIFKYVYEYCFFSKRDTFHATILELRQNRDGKPIKISILIIIKTFRYAATSTIYWQCCMTFSFSGYQ